MHQEQYACPGGRRRAERPYLAGRCSLRRVEGCSYIQPMTELERLVGRARDVFEDVESRAFDVDRTINPELRVEVVEAAMAGDTPTLLLITPWTVFGLAFPPDGRLPDRLAIGGELHRVHGGAIEGIGLFRSVSLVPDVWHVPSPAHARKVARILGPAFREAVAKARRCTQPVGRRPAR